MGEIIPEKNIDHVEAVPAVSIIIPVFNRERFIGSLLRSVSLQSFSDFEVICVDNGSTDGTRDVIMPFCEKDDRFRCVTKEHGSAGSARNKGLDLARGKYIVFLDSDDSYHRDLLKELVASARKHNADEVFCLCEEYNYRTHTYRKDLGYNYLCFPDDTPLKTAEIADLFQHINWVVTNTLFLKDIIDRHHLRFPDSRASEDVLFICEYAALTETIVGIRKTLVTFRRYIDDQSLTTSVRWRHLDDMIYMLIELYDWLNKNGLYNQFRETYILLFIYSIKTNGQFPFNPKYVDAITETLCTKEPFQGLDEQEFYDRYWKILDTNSLEKVIRDFYSSANAGEDKIQRYGNLLLTIVSVEAQAQRKYGRFLNPQHKRKSI